MKSTRFVPPHRLFLTWATRIAWRTPLRTVSLAAMRTFSECVSSSRDCSDRELLTHSEKVRIAASETVRNGVRQAILVAQVKNKRCGGTNLVDFIFNYVQGEWKLFSAP